MTSAETIGVGRLGFGPFFTFFRGAVGVSGLPGEDDEALASDALLAVGLALR